MRRTTFAFAFVLTAFTLAGCGGSGPGQIFDVETGLPIMTDPDAQPRTPVGPVEPYEPIYEEDAKSTTTSK